MPDFSAEDDDTAIEKAVQSHTATPFQHSICAASLSCLHNVLVTLNLFTPLAVRDPKKAVFKGPPYHFSPLSGAFVPHSFYYYCLCVCLSRSLPVSFPPCLFLSVSLSPHPLSAPSPPLLFLFLLLSLFLPLFSFSSVSLTFTSAEVANHHPLPPYDDYVHVVKRSKYTYQALDLSALEGASSTFEVPTHGGVEYESGWLKQDVAPDAKFGAKGTNPFIWTIFTIIW